MPERVVVSTVDTSLGPMTLATTSRGLAAIARGPDLVPDLEGRFPGCEVVTGAGRHDAWVLAWAAGERREPPPIDVRGLSPFDAAVYRAVRGIGWGDTATYGEVALMVGRPGAARAVGGAMSRCPLFPAVPCHRVVRAADGWSGWGGSDALKRQLLDRESDRP